MTSSVAEFETTGATFLPLAEVPMERSGASVDLSRSPMALRITTRLEKSLAQLVRRACRIGPVDGGTIVLLTGCGNGVGCSTLSLALAATACRDQRVALIDADFQSAALTRQLGQASELGWEEAVRQRDYEDAGQALDSQGSLSFFSQRVSSAGPNQLVTSSGLAAWLAWLRQEFAVIFLDGGSLQIGGTQWAPWTDAALVVCRSGPELSEEWSRAWDRLEESGAHVLGIIETFV